MINTKKLIFVLSFFICSLFHVSAQRPNKHMKGKAFDGKVIESLNLNVDQMAALETLKKDSKAKAQAIRSDESITDKRAALKENRELGKAAFEDILNEEQLLKYKSAQADRKITRDKRKAELEAFKSENKEEIDAMKAEMKAYHESSIRPTILQERIAFDKVLDASDKKLIDEIRKDLKSNKKQAKKNVQSSDDPKRQARREGRHNTRSYFNANPDKKEQLTGMIEKYKTNLVAVETSLAANRSTWENDLKAIKEKHLAQAKQKSHPNEKRANADRKTERLDFSSEAEQVKFLLMRTEKRAKK